ncbi:MAG: dephospho-CoA kinase [Legionellales bacterium]|nr:dephospho-CoA kinase [Legionellales bacterium]
MVYCIGLTGNIASGKSTVAHYFSDLGIEVISADAIARDLTSPDAPPFQLILSHFGPKVLTQDGGLNRHYLRQLIIQDEKARLWLEKLLHPLIQQHIQASTKNVKSSYCVIEIPLLTDRTTYPYLNQVLMIQSQKELQIERCMSRDQTTKEDILALLELQAKDKQHLRTEETLNNNGSLEQLKKEVAILHARYLRCAALSFL